MGLYTSLHTQINSISITLTVAESGPLQKVRQGWVVCVLARLVRLYFVVLKYEVKVPIEVMSALAADGVDHLHVKAATCGTTLPAVVGILDVGVLCSEAAWSGKILVEAWSVCHRPTRVVRGGRLSNHSTLVGIRRE